MASEMTHEEAQEAVDNGDEVTTDELQEMHPDKNLNRILYDIQREQVESEMKSKIEESYKFNEPRYAAKQGRKTCHTGPKGVLTDFEEAKLKMRALRINDKIKKEQIKYMNIGGNSNMTQFQHKIIDKNKQKPTAKQLRREKQTDIKSQEEDIDDIDSDDLLEDEDDNDEEALLRYKLAKMKIMEENRPRYGDTKELTAWTFEKEVDMAPLNVWVVVHVYQDYMERCGRMNYAIAQIAKSYQHIKFMRARSDRIGLDTYPEVGLPTIIIFKNGKQLQNHIAVHEIINKIAFSVKDVEQFLIDNGVIKPVTFIPDMNDNGDGDGDDDNYKKYKKTNFSFKNNSKTKFSSSKNNESSGSELDID
eukprot:80074_1